MSIDPAQLAALSGRGGGVANAEAGRSGNRVPRPAGRPMTRVGLPLALVLIAAILVGYSARQALLPRVEVQVAAAAPVKVDASEPDRGGERVAQAVQAPGWIEPAPYAVSVPALAAGVVREVLVLEGDEVKVGQVVARLDVTDARLALRQAEALRAEAVASVARAEREVALSEARIAELQDELERKQRLSGTGAVSDADLAKLDLRKRASEREADAARAGVEMARASVASRQVACDRAQLEVDRMNIVSPADGVVLQRLIEPGMRLNMDSLGGSAALETGVLRIYNPKRLQARVDVPMGDAAKIVPGAAAVLTTEAAPGREYQGVVERVVHEANIQRNTVQFKVSLRDADDVLKPEMLCRVRLAGISSTGHEPASAGGGRVEAVSVPASAVKTSGNGQGSAWVVMTDERLGPVARLREVVVGKQGADDEVIVLSGLHIGDRVVISPDSTLRDGTPVQVRSGSHAQGEKP